MYCKNCGIKLDKGALFCPNCGTKVSDTEAVRHSLSGKKKKVVWKIAIFAATGIAALAFCILFLPKLSGMLGNGEDRERLLYLKDNELFLVEPDTCEPVRLTDECYVDENSISSDTDGFNRFVYGKQIRTSPDYGYLYYASAYNRDYWSFDLYRKRLGDKEGEEEKIGSDVVRYEIVDNSRLVYIKGKDDRRLYLYDQGSSEKIDSDVSEVYVSPDGRKLIWSTNGEETGLYTWDLDMEQEKEKLFSDVEWYMCSDDLSTVVVLTKEKDLYVVNDRADKKKIDSDVLASSLDFYSYSSFGHGYGDGHVYWINDSPQIYYLKEDSIGTLYDWIVEDDCLEKDKEMEQAQSEEYQRKLDRDAVREEMKEMDLIDIIPVHQPLAIYHYNAETGTSSKVADMISCQFLQSEKSALMLCTEFDLENMEKLKLSEIMEMLYSEEDDVLSKIEETVYGCMKKSYIKDGKIYEIHGTDGAKKDAEEWMSIELVCFAEEIHTMYFRIGSGIYSYDYDNLYAELELLSDKAETIAKCDADGIYYIDAGSALYCNDEKMDGDVYGGSFQGGEFLNAGYYSTQAYEGLLYLKDFDEARQEGTLKLCRNGRSVKIDEDVSVESYILLEENGDVLYLTDVDKDKQEGILNWYQNGQSRRLAGDVAVDAAGSGCRGRYKIFDGDKAVFLSDYNFEKGKGDLRVYDEKETMTVDTDVQWFFISNYYQ